jgi:hypothetical protein
MIWKIKYIRSRLKNWVSLEYRNKPSKTLWWYIWTSTYILTSMKSVSLQYPLGKKEMCNVHLEYKVKFIYPSNHYATWQSKWSSDETKISQLHFIASTKNAIYIRISQCPQLLVPKQTSALWDQRVGWAAYSENATCKKKKIPPPFQKNP